MELKNQEIPQAEFERVLHQIVDMELENWYDLLHIKGVMAAVAEHYRDRVVLMWQEEQRLARTTWATLTDRVAGPRLRWVRDHLRFHYSIDTRMLGCVLQVPLKELGQAMEVLVEKFGVRRVIDMADDDVMFRLDDECEEG